VSKRHALATALLSLAAGLAAACGSSPAATATPVATVTSVPIATATPAAEASPAHSSSSVQPIFGTTVLRVGTQRFAFLLEGSTALVTAPTVGLTARFDGEGTGDAPPVTATADFYGWPFGTRGSYVTELTFDRAGPWRLDITVEDDGPAKYSTLVVDVAETVEVREIGTLPPFSNTKTLSSVGGDLTLLTTHFRPDPDLYQTSIAESLFSGKPTVIVFASPAFCTSPTCGPQVDTVAELKDLHPGEADFIHVEVYDNPEEIQGDLSRGVLSPVLMDWGIDSVPDYLNESWVFVLGQDGRIASRFEGYATLAELEAALQRVL
jgi:hypothetical protein